MASLRDIRKRIRSVKNTRQITKAMKMVAAAKLRKAQEAMLAARPYASALDRMISDLASRSEELSHPLLAARAKPRRAELLVVTSDRGLAGGFNSNVIRRANRFLFENHARYEQLTLSTVGRKGRDFFRRRPEVEVRKDHSGLFSKLDYQVASELAQELAARFLAGEVDEVFLVYNEFVSAITQKVVVVPLLPLSAPSASGEQVPAGGPAVHEVDFKYEPSRQRVLDDLVPQALAIRVHRALLESVASEHGARMSAMENATTNATDMIGKLSLVYNRTRQAVITKELMEIVSGAEALK